MWDRRGRLTTAELRRLEQESEDLAGKALGTESEVDSALEEFQELREEQARLEAARKALSAEGARVDEFADKAGN